MQPEGSRRHRYSSNMCGDRAFLRTESHTARRGSCFLFFLHTAPNCYYYSFFLQRNQYFLLYMCWQIMPTAGLCSTWPTLGPLWNVTQNGPLPFWRRHFPYLEKAEHAPVPHKASLPVSGQQRRFFFPAASPFVLLIAHFFTCHIRSPVFLFISSSFFVFFFTGYTLFAFAIAHMCIYISKCWACLSNPPCVLLVYLVLSGIE